ncbi:Uncharacterized protein TCM_039381 [Theobroma cacao]|uniref:Uncharacterized protein n=1 Tax=Theobroma cacao TaxID=3641 RepID=A0A061GS39_THECC|nr:Uncharacterized protein TCM_039381 [Theobroma cacao]
MIISVLSKLFKTKKWKKAMDEEMKAIQNDTWSLTSLLEGKKAASVKDRIGGETLHKKADIDYGEVFVSVAWLESITLMISLAAHNVC